MKHTGDQIVDAVLKNFRNLVRPIIQMGRGVNFEDSLEQAVNAACTDLWPYDYTKLDVRQHVWQEEEMIRDKCHRIILDIEKRNSLMDIRKTSIEAILADFAATSGLSLTYKLRGNNTVGYAVLIPSSGKYLKFNASFSKTLSDEWRAGLMKDIQSFIAISDRLGSVVVSWNNYL